MRCSCMFMFMFLYLYSTTWVYERYHANHIRGGGARSTIEVGYYRIYTDMDMDTYLDTRVAVQLFK